MNLRWMALGVLFLALSCSFANAQQPKKFAMVALSVGDSYLNEARQGCKLAEQNSGGAFTCQYLGPQQYEGGVAEQMTILDSLIAQRVDGIAIWPADRQAVVPLLKIAKSAGINIATFGEDLDPENREVRIGYVGIGNSALGISIARMVERLKPNGGTICILMGGSSSPRNAERLHAIRDTLGNRSSADPEGQRLAGDNGWREVDGCPAIASNNPGGAAQALTQVLTAYPTLDALVLADARLQSEDSSFREAISPVANRVANKQLVIVGVGSTALQLKQLDDGLTAGQVGTPLQRMGYITMLTLRDGELGAQIHDPNLLDPLEIWSTSASDNKQCTCTVCTWPSHCPNGQDCGSATVPCGWCCK